MAYADLARPATGDLLAASHWIQMRDNWLANKLHKHGGAEGDGDDELGPGVDSINFDDVAGPAAPGAGKTIIYSNAGRLRQRAGAAGIARRLSIVGHTHTGPGVPES